MPKFMRAAVGLAGLFPELVRAGAYLLVGGNAVMVPINFPVPS